jgi:hypothetical protein
MSLLLLTSLKLILSLAIVLGYFVFRRLYHLLKNCLLCAHPIQFQSRLGLPLVDFVLGKLGTQVLTAHGFLMAKSISQNTWTLILARESTSTGRQFLTWEQQIQGHDQTSHLTTTSPLPDHSDESTIQLSAKDWVKCMGIQRTLSFFDPMLAMAQHAAARELHGKSNFHSGT